MLQNGLFSRLLNTLVCPDCGGNLYYDSDGQQYMCRSCGQAVLARDGKPLFIEVAQDVYVFEKRARGPNLGTPWRRANWSFLQSEVDKLPLDALILDVGTGRGDFSAIFEGRDFLALDIYPYPEVDVVADLTLFSPFKPDSFDMVVLMNVVEHVYDTGALLKEVEALLKPGGVLVIAVPFLLKVHQAPYDFVRYTEFALRRWVKYSGLAVTLLEGYYDPVFMLGEGLGNLRYGVMPRLSRSKRYLVGGLVETIRFLGRMIEKLVGMGYTRKPAEEISPAPVGYHLVCKKPEV